MAIDYDKLMAWRFEDVRHRYTQRDTMLYALGVGLGTDPCNETELRFVYEKNLLALPTLPVVLGYPGMWLKDPATGVDWVRLVHGEQGLKLHRPIPAEGDVIGRTRVTGIIDKGQGKGALIYTERSVVDAASGDLLATLTSTTFCRADGGFGGPSGPVKSVHELPTRAPDHSTDFATQPRAALIYRLSGDYNPLHAEPAVARAAGFERPILHGLATYAIAGWAIVKTVCGGDPHAVGSIDVRFSSPVYPGETIRTEMWVDGKVVSFRALAVERNVVVLNNGRAELR
ncbi:MaoC/PaaZ C-terminal domain-containing protein [Extensimonas sp. H3M7-6]|uniref:MaoC/PaaZ C-terminal domain-containing protein n=1 Tax=Extensimonas soli TaxID=3031322 RepID=UPI0023DC13E9|nr:MaoC/PaaZ C-terminal domain-containing protein [Extensimonas sp. H3M7-6]MDF1483090.1 MaoC/PaaZ C-terminal domain-containing protein [Extensimonas sp. H3M7-6]